MFGCETMKKILMLLTIMFTSILLFGCNEELQTYREESIIRIEEHYKEIQDMNLEYSLALFEYEMENAKILIQKTRKIDKIKSIEEDAINKMNNLVLSKDEKLYIRQTAHNRAHSTFTDCKEDCVSVTKYFGKYGDSIVVSTYGIVFVELMVVGPKGFWIFNLSGKSFHFNCKRTEILVFFEDDFYTLDDAFHKDIISIEHVEDIYNKYLILFNVE